MIYSVYKLYICIYLIYTCIVYTNRKISPLEKVSFCRLGSILYTPPFLSSCSSFPFSSSSSGFILLFCSRMIKWNRSFWSENCKINEKVLNWNNGVARSMFSSIINICMNGTFYVCIDSGILSGSMHSISVMINYEIKQKCWLWNVSMMTMTFFVGGIKQINDEYRRESVLAMRNHVFER